MQSTKAASTLFITEVATKVAKDDRNYKVVTAVQVDTTITFAPKMVPGQGIVMVKSALPTMGEKARRFTSWEKDSDAIGGATNYQYMNLVQGASIPGAFVEREVADYDIPTGDSDPQGQPIMRTLTKATVAVIGDNTQPDWESKVQKAFKARGFQLVTATVTNIDVVEDLPVAAGNNADDDIPF